MIDSWIGGNIAKTSVMSSISLIDTARTLLAGYKGLIATNESTPTCNKRFARLGNPQPNVRAALFEETGLVPVVESEVLMDDEHFAEWFGVPRVGRAASSLSPGPLQAGGASPCMVHTHKDMPGAVRPELLGTRAGPASRPEPLNKFRVDKPS